MHDFRGNCQTTVPQKIDDFGVNSQGQLAGLRRADEALPRRASEEARRELASKGRFYEAHEFGNCLFIYVIAGEASGDLHGGPLLSHLKALCPGLTFKGVGGPEMNKSGLHSLLPFADFQVMGFSDVLFALPRLRNHFHFLSQSILNDNPKAVIFIDYPGFNLRLAKHLRKKGYKGKLVHYIAPTVWAWKKNRALQMAEVHDLLLTIYPFESAYFSHTSLNVKYAGNPLLHSLPKAPPSLNAGQPLLALFPGSRPKEIERNFPLQMQAAELFLQKHPEFKIAISINDPSMLKDSPKHALVIEPDSRYSLMCDASLALAKSGTVTLELALYSCPTVVQYRLTRLNHFLARYLFRIDLPYFALPNILLQEQMFPEWYRVNISPQELAESLEEQLKRKQEVQEQSGKLRELLGDQNASKTAALEILKLC
jgi:lipid-A-disaccharide synthase